jgi:O-antigen ligase
VTRVIRWCDLAIEAGIIGLLLMAPLPFGSVYPWAQSALQAGVAALAALTVTRMLAAREVVIPRHPLLWPGLAMVVLVSVQLFRAEGSVSPYATWRSAQLFVALFAFLVVLALHLVTRARIIRLVAVIVAWGVVLALVGLGNHAMGGTRILWLPKLDYLERLTSTFVNPNHQALYFSIPLFLAIGLLLQVPPPARVGPAPPRPASSAWRIGTVGQVLLAGAVLIIGVALLLTASRGGVLGVLAGLGVLLVLTMHRRLSWGLPIAIGLAAVAFVGYGSGFALDLLLERFQVVAREPLGDLRWPIWESTIQLIRERPVLGAGLGAYEDAFRVRQPLSIWIMKLVDYAHNDYLQLVAETGVLGLLILLWAAVAFAVFVVSRWLGRKDLFVRGLVMGGLAALTSVAVHSATDFGLHMPANALLVVTLAALLPAVATLRLHRSGYRVDLDQWRMPLSSVPRVTMGAAALVVCVIAILVPVGPALADWQLRRALAVAGGAQWAAGSVTLRDLDQATGRLSVAARLDPWNPAVQAALAQVTDELARRVWLGGVSRDGRRLGDTSPAGRLAASRDLLATAHDSYQASLRTRPRASETHERFAWFLGRLETIRKAAVVGATGTPLAPALAGVLTSDESILPRALHHFGEAIRW